MNHCSSRLNEAGLADVVAGLFVGYGVLDDADEFFVGQAAAGVTIAPKSANDPASRTLHP